MIVKAKVNNELLIILFAIESFNCLLFDQVFETPRQQHLSDDSTSSFKFYPFPLVTSNKNENLNDRKIDLIDNGWIEIDNEDQSNNISNNIHDRLNFIYEQDSDTNIESTERTYIVKCDTSYYVNSNSNYVRKHARGLSHFKWLPVDGFLNKKLPLCAKVCKFQSNLKNGLVQIDSNVKIVKRLSDPSMSKSNNDHYVELFETGRIKYSCLVGFQLKTTQRTNKKIIYSKKYFIERCKSTAQEQQEQTFNDLQTLLTNENFEYNSLDPNNFMSIKNIHEDKINMHECIKICKSFKLSPTKLNGIIVPLHEAYKPNERISLMCKEGYAAQLNNITSNLFHFECTANATWKLFDKSMIDFTNSSNTTQQDIDQDESINFIKEMPICQSLKMRSNLDSDIFLNDGEELNAVDSTNSFNTRIDSLIANTLTFENLKRISIMFIVGLILMSVIILAVLKYKLSKHQRLNHLIQHRIGDDLNTTDNIISSNTITDQFHLNLNESCNATAELNITSNQDLLRLITATPLVLSNHTTSQNSTAPTATTISNNFFQTPRSIASPFNFNISNLNTQTLNSVNSYLPSYEEAIAQGNTSQQQQRPEPIQQQTSQNNQNQINASLLK